ncbi:glycosyltransferase [Pontibacter diazotrophicus]|uniref:glycosyltransferase n=1 Tax=Pontibacter diazotrophicus TaxID=1400979 RepID=UPI0015F18EF3|nr:glycosyltransferase [Pontibacter diazotrophicus]
MDELEWPNFDTFNIACVARINFKIKRQDIMINVFAQEKWRNRNITVNFYGEGPDTSNLQMLIKNQTFEDQVTMHGQTEDIRHVGEYNHVLILPFVAEGLPLALIVANLLGRAAITTNVGDNERLVLQNETGFLINDLSSKALDNTLEEAWNKRYCWEQLSSRARIHALQNLDINIHKSLLSQLN